MVLKLVVQGTTVQIKNEYSSHVLAGVWNDVFSDDGKGLSLLATFHEILHPLAWEVAKKFAVQATPWDPIVEVIIGPLHHYFDILSNGQKTWATDSYAPQRAAYLLSLRLGLIDCMSTISDEFDSLGPLLESHLDKASKYDPVLHKSLVLEYKIPDSTINCIAELFRECLTNLPNQIRPLICDSFLEVTYHDTYSPNKIEVNKEQLIEVFESLNTTTLLTYFTSEMNLPPYFKNLKVLTRT